MTAIWNEAVLLAGVLAAAFAVEGGRSAHKRRVERKYYQRYKDTRIKTMNKPESQYPLLEQGIPPAKCPMCGLTCYPEAVDADTTVIYSLHCCNPPAHDAANRRFTIGPDGVPMFYPKAGDQQSLEVSVAKLIKQQNKL